MTPIKPDPQDFAEVERQYGPLPDNASREALLYRYQLAQATKLIRLHNLLIERECVGVLPYGDDAP
jgi:hypothetical protein